MACWCCSLSAVAIAPMKTIRTIAAIAICAGIAALASGCGGGEEPPSAAQMKALALTGLAGQETRLRGPPTGWTGSSTMVLPKYCWPKSLGDSIQATSDSSIAFRVRGAASAAEVEVNVLAFPDEATAAEARTQIDDAMRECISQGVVTTEVFTVTYKEGSVGGAFALTDSVERTQEQIDRAKALGYTVQSSSAGIRATRQTGRYVVFANGGWEAPTLEGASFASENSATVAERVTQALNEQVARVEGKVEGSSSDSGNSSGSDNGNSSGNSGDLEQEYKSSQGADCEQARQDAYNELRNRGWSASDARDGADIASGC